MYLVALLLYEHLSYDISDLKNSYQYILNQNQYQITLLFLHDDLHQKNLLFFSLLDFHQIHSNNSKVNKFSVNENNLQF